MVADPIGEGRPLGGVPRGSATTPPTGWPPQLLRGRQVRARSPVRLEARGQGGMPREGGRPGRSALAQS
eukprot:15432320-Alexandrium_andersonii.AAC.1